MGVTKIGIHVVGTGIGCLTMAYWAKRVDICGKQAGESFCLLLVEHFIIIDWIATVGVQAAVATELDSVQQISDRIQEPYQQLLDDVHDDFLHHCASPFRATHCGRSHCRSHGENSAIGGVQGK